MTTLRLCVTAGMAAAPLAFVAAPASAAPHPAPLCGAYNMLEASSYYPYAVSTGMDTAMTRNNPNGNGVPGGTTGMWGAITHSSGSSAPACRP